MNKKIYDKLQELKELSKEEGDLQTAAMAATLQACENDREGKVMLSNIVHGFTQARADKIRSEIENASN